jgi:hypothetical protein
VKKVLRCTISFLLLLREKLTRLFLENKEEIWGTYDEESMKVKVQDEQTSENTSLMNLAAVKVLENKGSVYLN